MHAMLKRYLILLLLFVAAIATHAQIFDPVAWNFGYEKKGENLYELIYCNYR